MMTMRALALAVALAAAIPAAAQQAPATVQTASGLRYQVLAAGSGGSHPTDADVVLVNYEGKLVDGSTFDKSEQPAAFPVRGVVPGFSEALKLMAKGAKLRVWIPPQLGYGADEKRGPDGAVEIPANATLVFDIELLDFVSEAEMAAGQGTPTRLAEPNGAPDPAEAGLTPTASGLRIKTLTPATETLHPTDADVVLVHYIGRLADGAVFDRSAEPMPLPVREVVPGFSEALKLMSRGGTYRVWIKPELGYGDRAMPGPDGQPGIPANATLVFDVELIDYMSEVELMRLQREAAQPR